MVAQPCFHELEFSPPSSHSVTVVYSVNQPAQLLARKCARREREREDIASGGGVVKRCGQVLLTNNAKLITGVVRKTRGYICDYR